MKKIDKIVESSTQERILKAARDLMWGNGYNSTTTKMIAEKAGVNEVTIFRIYKNKKNILIDMLKYLSEKESPLDDFLGKNFDSMEDFINRFYDLFFEKFLQIRDIFLLCIKESGGENTELSKNIVKLMRHDSVKLAKRMYQFNTNESLEEKDYEIGVYTFTNSLISALMLQLITGDEKFPFDMEEFKEKLKFFLLRGLK